MTLDEKITIMAQHSRIRSWSVSAGFGALAILIVINVMQTPHLTGKFMIPPPSTIFQFLQVIPLFWIAYRYFIARPRLEITQTALTIINDLGGERHYQWANLASFQPTPQPRTIEARRLDKPDVPVRIDGHRYKVDQPLISYLNAYRTSIS